VRLNIVNIFLIIYNMKYVNLSSSIDIGFWHVLGRKKLDEFKLDNSPKPIRGYYTVSTHTDISNRFYIVPDSLQNRELFGNMKVQVEGSLVLCNTIEEFKNLDKNEVLLREANQFSLGNPNRFVMVVYADLKNFQFYYWCGFPLINFTGGSGEGKKVNDVFREDELKEALCEKAGRDNLQGFFSVKEENARYQIGEVDYDSEIIGFIDPSSLMNTPSCVIRNLLCQIAQKRKGKIQLLAVRDFITTNISTTSLSKSCVFELELPEDVKETCVGWEKNEKGKLGPKRIDVRPLMDPLSLSQSSVDLNLKLMKWRMVPDLNLDSIMNCKCLLLGAGTLGCQIARNLLAWGVKHFTFVDGGKVSYSNPVRQSLLTFEDAKRARSKAEAAAENLSLIHPQIYSKGIHMTFPNAGHKLINEEESKHSFEVLESLIQSHDVTFLLTDTRESRWLPTLISAALDKPAFSVALGFDSYVVIRHGGHPSKPNRLGCYFCNDVVAPRNSTIDRTLDQQCTVTRPGLSYISSAACVELLVSMLQNSSGINAAADESGCLGEIPHQIRGSFGDFNMLKLTGIAFSKCAGCGEKVVEGYEKSGWEFLKQAIENPEWLESYVGLEDMIGSDEEGILEVDSFDSI
jgi:ubiquitin-like modifier-activating enzyme ATG7